MLVAKWFFLDEDQKGEVVEISGDGRVKVLLEEGLEVEVKKKRLILDKGFTVSTVFQKDDAIIEKYQRKAEVVAKEQIIDLHIEELVVDYTRIHPDDVLRKQLMCFKDKLDWAVNHQIPTLVVVHGVGEGVLKEEVWQMVRKRCPDAVCKEASALEFGYGATEITFN